MIWIISLEFPDHFPRFFFFISEPKRNTVITIKFFFRALLLNDTLQSAHYLSIFPLTTWASVGKGSWFVLFLAAGLFNNYPNDHLRLSYLELSPSYAHAQERKNRFHRLIPHILTIPDQKSWRWLLITISESLAPGASVFPIIQNPLLFALSLLIFQNEACT